MLGVQRATYRALQLRLSCTAAGTWLMMQKFLVNQELPEMRTEERFCGR